VVSGPVARDAGSNRGSVCMNLGRSRRTQALSELMLLFSVLSFCSLQRKKEKKKGKK
jgi:hypothetical protein